MNPRHEYYLPCVSPQSKRQIFAGRGDRLMLARHGFSFTLAKPRKAKSVEFIGVWIDSFVCMSSTGRNGDKCAWGNGHAIGKCERAPYKTGYRHWKDRPHMMAHQNFVLQMLKKESDEQMPRPSIRWVSRRKLSILCILSIPAFVQPSSEITVSTSRRRGSRYSGFASSRYNICASVY